MKRNFTTLGDYTWKNPPLLSLAVKNLSALLGHPWVVGNLVHIMGSSKDEISNDIKNPAASAEAQNANISVLLERRCGRHQVLVQCLLLVAAADIKYLYSAFC